MGWRFDLADANLVAYLTSPQRTAPSVTFGQLSFFLSSIANARDGNEAFISSDGVFLREFSMMAKTCLSLLGGKRDGGYVPKADLKRVLSHLKKSIRVFDVICLVIPGRSRYWREECEIFLRDSVGRAKYAGLFLLPDRAESLDLLTPFSPLVAASRAVSNDAGVVFWTRSGGASAYVSLEAAGEVVRRLGDAQFNDITYEDVLRSVPQAVNKASSIFHISDLHFGTEVAAARHGYVFDSVISLTNPGDTLVVTGDYTDSPNVVHEREFNEYLRRFVDSGVKTVVVPGNHDQRWHGNHIFGLGSVRFNISNNIVVDDETRTVFALFNSNESGLVFAKGGVTDKQIVSVEMQFNNLCAADPGIRQYERVALLHHHPIAFDSGKNSAFQKFLGKFHISDEWLLKMGNGDAFVQWAKDNNFSFVLHGHKHAPFAAEVGGGQDLVRVLGAGSAFGVDKTKMTFNVITRNLSDGAWSALYYVHNGMNGFQPEYVSYRRV